MEPDAQLRALVGDAVAARGECLGEQTWEALACGELAAPARAGAARHAAGCPRCADTWRALAALSREAALLGSGAPLLRDPQLPRRPRVLRWVAGGSALLAAAGLLVILQPRAPAEVRAPPAVAAVELLEPTGATPGAQPTRLRWRAHAGARCTARIRAPDGAPVFVAEATDRGEAALPASAALAAGRYYWEVDCGDGGRSALGAFAVR